MVPKRYNHASWEDIPAESQQKIRDAIKERRGVYIHGQVGTGKTHMAVAIYNRLKQKNIRARFHNTTELLFDIRKDISRDSYEKKRWDEVLPYYNGILILDDIGTEKVTDFVAETFYLIVNTRYNEMLPTIFTSNLKIGELADRVGDRTASRIVEMCTILPLVGEDRRLKNIKK